MKYWVMLQTLLQDRRGIAAVEYAVLIGVVGAAVFVAFETFDLGNIITNLLQTGLTPLENLDPGPVGG